MDDLDDVFEAVIDVEDIVEELFDPEDLLEDFRAEPLKILLALVAAGAAGFTLLTGAVLLVVLALRYGLVVTLVGLTALGFLTTLLALVAFLYVRSDVPHRVQRKLNRARARAGEPSEAPGDGTESPSRDGGSVGEGDETREERAIERLREQYAEREITIEEFEAELEALLGDDERTEAEYAVEQE